MKPIRKGSHTVGSLLPPCNRPVLTVKFVLTEQNNGDRFTSAAETSYDDCLPQSVTEGLSQGIHLECIDRKVSQEAVPWYNNGTNH